MIGALNRHATHPVNAMLNYAYRVLETQVKIATVAAGLDPTIGYLHTCRPGRMALVYDLMEPLRPKVDRVVLGFALSQVFTPQDFLLTERGGCRLHPSLTKRLLGMALDAQAIQDVIESAKMKHKAELTASPLNNSRQAFRHLIQVRPYESRKHR